MTDIDLSVVLSEMAELVNRFGKDKAMKILDCCNAIYQSTKDFPDDVKDDAIKWVMRIATKSTPQNFAEIPGEIAEAIQKSNTV